MRTTLEIVALTACLALSACMTPKAWQKSGASGADFEMDRGYCQAQAFSVPGAPAMQVGLVYSSCMRGKGWSLQ